MNRVKIVSNEVVPFGSVAVEHNGAMVWGGKMIDLPKLNGGETLHVSPAYYERFKQEQQI